MRLFQLILIISGFLITCGLLFSLLTGCSAPDKRSKLPTLHNYPIINARDCPVEWRNYNEAEVKERAKKLHMRPVDYLHWVNNKRYKNNK